MADYSLEKLATQVSVNACHDAKNQTDAPRTGVPRVSDDIIYEAMQVLVQASGKDEVRQQIEQLDTDGNYCGWDVNVPRVALLMQILGHVTDDEELAWCG
jgi:hypothetical protein